MARPAKYHSPEERRAAAARRQKAHRERRAASTVTLAPGAVVLSAEEAATAHQYLTSLKRIMPPIFSNDRRALDSVMVKLGGTCDVSL